MPPSLVPAASFRARSPPWETHALPQVYCMTRPRYPEDLMHTQSPLEVPPPISPFSVTGALSPLLLIPMAVPAVVALFAPLDVFAAWPGASRFTLWVQHMLPFVNMRGHADSTLFPQVAWLAHSGTVTVIPFMALVWLWQTMTNYPRLLARRRALGPLTVRQHLLMTLAGPPFVLALIYAFISIPGDPSFAPGFTTHSRIGFAFVSVVLVYLTSLVLGGQLLAIRLFKDLHLRREG